MRLSRTPRCTTRGQERPATGSQVSHQGEYMDHALRCMAYEACYRDFMDSHVKQQTLKVMGDSECRLAFIKLTERGIRSGIPINEDNDYARVLFTMIREEMYD